MWQIGTPITGYYHGPGGGSQRWGPLTPGMARKLVDGGFNTAWGCTVEDLDVAHEHGLRVEPLRCEEPHLRQTSGIPAQPPGMPPIADRAVGFERHIRGAAGHCYRKADALGPARDAGNSAAASDVASGHRALVLPDIDRRTPANRRFALLSSGDPRPPAW